VWRWVCASPTKSGIFMQGREVLPRSQHSQVSRQRIARRAGVMGVPGGRRGGDGTYTQIKLLQEPPTQIACGNAYYLIDLSINQASRSPRESPHQSSSALNTRCTREAMPSSMANKRRRLSKGGYTSPQLHQPFRKVCLRPRESWAICYFF
jgi:hypothetical protein